MLLLQSRINDLALIRGWSDDDVGYSGSPSKAEVDYPCVSQLTSTNQQLYILDCLFQQCIGDSGEAIHHEIDGQMLIEQSAFNSCQSTEQGGAIYKTKGESVINASCNTKSFSNGQVEGQFIYNNVSMNGKNRILDSSITHSMSDASNPSFSSTLFLFNGNILLNTVNLSNNFCNDDAVWYFETMTTNPKNNMTFLQICQNNATYPTIIYCIQYSSESFLDYSNIIQNTVQNRARETAEGLITCNSGYLTIRNSSIMNNNAQIILAANFQVTIDNCSIDFDSSKAAGSTNFFETSSKFTISLHFTETDKLLSFVPIKVEEEVTLDEKEHWRFSVFIIPLILSSD